MRLSKGSIGRHTAVGMSIGALAVVCGLLAFAAVAQAAVWTAHTDTRVFPTTKPGTQHVANLTAAGGEYEGVIVGLRSGARRRAKVTWVAGSDPLLMANSILDQVAFVHVRRPTTGTGAKAGLYPDPLLPRGFGQAFMTSPAAPRCSFSSMSRTARPPASTRTETCTSPTGPRA